MKLEVRKKAGKVITVGRELTAKEKAKEKLKAKLKAKSFQTMSRAEKDELLELLLIENGLIDTK